ncbi:uncharacterized protein LOC132947470 [Metopolophium dirhodum]|uniref:uncharacterized protein LOC132947470 n=1 Tax=Metopolophium dirhodum TaxID=44670 RepID=UPI00298F8E72|nr:uncharacterized protein LOC132947470 [Metopolophium dirhodum]XP_060873757.1 uncharacterized protein LOC132947470 [Metopolophium dirhodum]XP_060873758.1 uncharacterized protein LOC132947470 [Metopolophium dirhodum]XP_060873759.1 uncharacterized protein LOC132947470 [Metopolophium dirhodum]
MGRPKRQDLDNAADSKRSLVRARASRDASLRSIKKINTIAEEVKLDVDRRALFEAHYLSLKRFVDQFELEQQAVLNALVDLDNVVEFENVDAVVTDTMEEVCANIQLIATGFHSTSVNVTADNNVSTGARQTAQAIVLPKIELPKFDGNVLGWVSFRDMFQSLVHDNPDISNIQRYHFLILSLSGPALTVVKAIPLTADNYIIAWNALKQSFENQRLLASAHIDKLFSFVPLKKESLSSLSSFVHVFTENVSAIKALGVKDLAGFILFHIGARVIDTETRRLFEASIEQNAVPNLDILLQFVAHRCKILENVGTSVGTNDKPDSTLKGSSKKNKSGSLGKTSLSVSSTSTTSKCLFCQHEHQIYRCFVFKRKPVTVRRKFVSDHNLCFICLKTGHSVGSCTASFTCKKCEGRHNTLLHIENVGTKNNSETTQKEKSDVQSSTSKPVENNTVFAGTIATQATVVLGTAVVRIQDDTGVTHQVRILLDSGSQVSAITAGCATRLGLKRTRSHVEVVGLSQQPVSKVKGVTQCAFFPLQSDQPLFKANNVIILSQITGLMPMCSLPATVRTRYQHLVLADPEFDHPGTVDMLIGGDLYPMILQPKADIIHTPGLPSAMHTNLGWIIVGSLRDPTSLPLMSLTISAVPVLNETLQRFWTVEEPTAPVHSTTEDERCEEWFCKTVSRDTSGRFCVALPFRSTIEVQGNQNQDLSTASGLGSSRAMAQNRLFNIERRLAKDPELYSAYRDFMDEYLSLGHMRLAEKPGKYFIPHHAVVKRQNEKLKIRVVFDASAKSSSGLSLNDCLATGPKLQSDITDILLRSRFHKFLFIADIEKMYRQIRVNDADCAYQHILWRNSPTEEVKEYELCTITYGVNAAPFLAIRCLHQLDSENGSEFPLAENLLVTSTYVDDIVAGAGTEKEALELQDQVISLLRKGGFHLRKWASNCEAVLKGIAAEDRAMDPSFELKDDQSVKVLGLHWITTSDALGYHININKVEPTKRTILSTIARLYDPVGALGPVVFWAKCIMQELWIEKLDWDASPSSDIIDKWHKFTTELPALSSFSLSRYINACSSKTIQLLGFADASQKGYAAVVYMRVIDMQDEVTVHFLTGKTKVAPLKASQTDESLTIPRLELCAALLLARLLSHQLFVLRDIVTIDCVRAWSDSTIVLAWLNGDQKQFKIFVTNRVAKIRSLLPHCEWSHVRSSDNPADPASRGMLPEELLTNRLHLNGPEFLQDPNCQFSSLMPNEFSPEQLPEIKTSVKNVLFVQDSIQPSDMISQFSTLTKMQRVLAYCFRFARRRNIPKSSGPITRMEYERAMNAAILCTQMTYLSDLQKQIQNQGSITPTTIAQLAPFIDSNGIIRVGGRLKRALLDENAKYPILLPQKTHLTELIIRHFHHISLHGGSRLVLSMIHQKFWIISGRAAVRNITYSCIPCTKFRSINPRPFMGDLPAARVVANRPFFNVGMDYGGPFMVRESRRRGARTNKIYLAVFVCMSVKAVHLEAVSDISTDAFLAALDRFVARRGIPDSMYTDCGTNYVGAAKQLKKLFDEASNQHSLYGRIPCKWHFNPPGAPHFGGIWEAAVKSAKTHLKKVIGAQVYTTEEFTTLITRIEGVLNSRPIVPLSSDPNDLNVLTPGHFLIGQPLLALPEEDVVNTPTNRLGRWQLLRQAQQSFWRRWSHEYLHTLQGRQKWFRQTPNLMVGDLVVINTPSRPPMSWQIGRIIEVHPGEDNIVRVATVKTQEGTLKRPVIKLVKLPVDPRP